MSDPNDKNSPERRAGRRTAISAQLRYIANRVENGTLTGFNLVWDGQDDIVGGEAVQDIGAMLDIKIKEQKAQIAALREAHARAREARAEAAPPADPEPSTLN